MKSSPSIAARLRVPTLPLAIVLVGISSGVLLPSRLSGQGEVCSERDARPTLDAWAQGTAKYQQGDYAGASPLLAQVARYFGGCVSQGSEGWRKYNHLLWQARAEYMGGVATYMAGDEPAARRMLARSRTGWNQIIGATGVARSQDVATAQATIARINSDLRVWTDTRGRGGDPPPTPTTRPDRRATTDDPSCGSIVGVWRVTLPADSRTLRTTGGLLTIRDLGGNNYEGIMTNPAWRINVSFHDVRYAGPWQHDDLRGSVSLEVTVDQETAEMRGTLEGFPTPQDRGRPRTLIGYKSCGT